MVRLEQKKTCVTMLLLAVALALTFPAMEARKVGVGGQKVQRKEWYFGMLPKGVPIPPSGPSVPQPPPDIKAGKVGVGGQKVHSRKWNFEILPKGVPIPPSGPSTPPLTPTKV